MVPQNKAIINAAYSAVCDFTALVKPGLSKSIAVNVLISFLKIPEKSPTEWYDISDTAKEYKHDPEASKGMKHLLVLIIIVLVYSF